MKCVDYYSKEDLDKYIEYAEKYGIKKKIVFYDTLEYNREGDFSIYKCFVPWRYITVAEYHSKYEMLYLQRHGFVFIGKKGGIININTLIN